MSACETKWVDARRRAAYKTKCKHLKPKGCMRNQVSACESGSMRDHVTACENTCCHVRPSGSRRDQVSACETKCILGLKTLGNVSYAERHFFLFWTAIVEGGHMGYRGSMLTNTLFLYFHPGRRTNFSSILLIHFSIVQSKLLIQI